MEGSSAIFVSYQGKVTKCAPESVRRATEDEKLGFSVSEQLAEMERELAAEGTMMDADPAVAPAAEQPEERAAGDPEHESGAQLPTPTRRR